MPAPIRRFRPSSIHVAAILTLLALAPIGIVRAQMPPESPPIPDAQIPQNIKDAVASPDRPPVDLKLDAGRKPAQMLAFFAIKPGMQVADIFAGGGYTTELLSRAVGPKGKVYSQNIEFGPQLKQIGEAWQARLKRPAMSNVVAVTKNLDAPDILPAPPNSLDAVIINMNYHDLVLFKLPRDGLNAQVYKALKPGGVYGVIDHSAKASTGDTDVKLHRIDEDFLVKEIEKAGFKLDAASSALRNPADDRTWSTSPREAGAKRGTSDRFMLRFVKPAA